METNFIKPFISHFQDAAYRSLNAFSSMENISLRRSASSRLISIPVALLDVSLETLKTPLAAIEHLIMVIINVLGMLFYPRDWFNASRYSVRDTLWNLDHGVSHIAQTASAAFIAPLKLIYQVFVSVLDPAVVESINYIHNGSKRHKPNYPHYFQNLLNSF